MSNSDPRKSGRWPYLERLVTKSHDSFYSIDNLLSDVDGFYSDRGMLCVAAIINAGWAYLTVRKGSSAMVGGLGVALTTAGATHYRVVVSRVRQIEAARRPQFTAGKSY